MEDLPQRVYDAIEKLNDAIISAETAGFSCAVSPSVVECPRPGRKENMAARFSVRVFMEIPSTEGGVH